MPVGANVGPIALLAPTAGPLDWPPSPRPQEEKPVPITVYGPHYSTYVRTARLALEEKGLTYDLVEVDILKGEHKEPGHLARNPFGPVPAFEHDGFALYETDAIVRYIERIEPNPPLIPSDAKAEARMNQIIGVVNSFAYQPVVWGIFVERVLTPSMGGSANEAKITESVPKARLCLDELARLKGDGEFLTGEKVSLADLFVAPVIAYLEAAPEGKELLAPQASLRRWWESMQSRPSVQKVMPPA